MSRKVMNGLDLQNRPIDNVADAGSPQQAVTKNQLDAAIRGLDWKQEVIAASTGNVSLTAPGTTLDGVTLTSGDRILLKDQTTASQNGVYVWTGGSATLTRAPDLNTGPQISGATTTVQRGTVNADRVYRVTTDDPLTVDTTAISWVQVGAASQAYTAGNGLTLSGGQFAVVPGTGILADGTSTRIDPSVVPRKYSAAVGNGSQASIAVAHGLNTRDVTVSVYDTASNEEVWPDVVRTDVNTITLGFATAPGTGAYRVVVIG